MNRHLKRRAFLAPALLFISFGIHGLFARCPGHFKRLAAVEQRIARTWFNPGIVSTQAGAPTKAAEVFRAPSMLISLISKEWFNFGVTLERSFQVEDAA